MFVNFFLHLTVDKSDRLCRCGGDFMFSRCNKEEKEPNIQQSALCETLTQL